MINVENWQQLISDIEWYLEVKSLEKIGLTEEEIIGFIAFNYKYGIDL